MPVIAIPKTMDNDVQGTEYCIALHRHHPRKGIDYPPAHHAGFHERIGVFRIFGRDAGFTALYTAYVTSTRCLIPEYPFDLDHVAEILSHDKHENLSHYAVVVVSEAPSGSRAMLPNTASRRLRHRKKADIGQVLGDEIRRRTGDEIMNQRLDL